jgi:hypothetical protein
MRIIDRHETPKVPQDIAYFAQLPVGAVLKAKSADIYYTKVKADTWVVMHYDNGYIATVGPFDDASFANSNGGYRYYPDAHLVLGLAAD